MNKEFTEFPGMQSTICADIKPSRALQVEGAESADIKPSRAAPGKLLRVVTVCDKGPGNGNQPYVHSFIYPKGQEPFLVKGNGKYVSQYLEENYENTPYIEHCVCFVNARWAKDGKRKHSYVTIHFPDHVERKYKDKHGKILWVSLKKSHWRPRATYESDMSWSSNLSTVLSKSKDRHEKWYLFTRGGGSPVVLKTFRKPPRAWLPELDQFLENT